LLTTADSATQAVRDQRRFDFHGPEAVTRDIQYIVDAGP